MVCVAGVVSMVTCIYGVCVCGDVYLWCVCVAGVVSDGDVYLWCVCVVTCIYGVCVCVAGVVSMVTCIYGVCVCGDVYLWLSLIHI